MEELAGELHRFAAERDLGAVSHAVELAISLAVEVDELLEHVQWGSDDEIAAQLGIPDGRLAVAEDWPTSSSP